MFASSRKVYGVVFMMGSDLDGGVLNEVVLVDFKSKFGREVHEGKGCTVQHELT